jgi:hypothetical protein
MLVHKTDRGYTWPGSWYKFYGGLYPKFRKAKGVPVFAGVYRKGTDEKYKTVYSDCDRDGDISEFFSNSILYEIVLVPNNAPEDISAIGEI